MPNASLCVKILGKQWLAGLCPISHRGSYWTGFIPDCTNSYSAHVPVHARAIFERGCYESMLQHLKTFGARLVRSSAWRWANRLTLGYIRGPVDNDSGRRFTRKPGIGRRHFQVLQVIQAPIASQVEKG